MSGVDAPTLLPKSHAWLSQRVAPGLVVFALMLSSALPARATYEWEALGGTVSVGGMFESELRIHYEDDFYVRQWTQRAQFETSIFWENVGLLDELGFTAVLRPEFDVAYYFDGLTDRHVGRGARRDSYLGAEFNQANNPGLFSLYSGVDSSATGGLVKNVRQGLWRSRRLKNYETIGAGTGFPNVAPRNQDAKRCFRCRDVDDSHTDVALNRTGSSGALYPFRELFADLSAGRLSVRVGKQQVVWGKTDFFRLQDLVNPVDFGTHFFFDPFVDIRIPQWMLSAQWRLGSIGPVTDPSLQLVWNFDEFRSVGLGNPAGGFAHPFGKLKGGFAVLNQYFSPEPCAPLNGLPCGSDPDGTGPGVWPSGLGVPVGILEERRPRWNLGNTEIGLRFEGRLGPLRFALTNYYGWGDTPVFRLNTVNIDRGILDPTVAANFIAAHPNAADRLWVDRSTGFGFDMVVATPPQAVQLAVDSGFAPAIDARRRGDILPYYSAGAAEGEFTAPGAGTGFAILGAQTTEDYKKNNTTGLSVDYFEEITGIVFRVESTFTRNELVTNTRKANWVDESDVIRVAVGLDRPTMIPFLNPTRPFFLSAQIFQATWLDWEGDSSRGFITPRRQWIYTAFAQGNYLRDRFTPQGFVIWEQSSAGWIGGFEFPFYLNEHWSVAVGGNFTWDGLRNTTQDVGPFTSFTLDGRPRQETVLGFARRGAAVFRENDEFFFRVRLAF